MIDGLSRSGAFWRITFPLLAPGLVATGIFGFIQAWNEFVFALVLNPRPEAMTLPVWLRTFLDPNGGINWARAHGGVHSGRDPGRRVLPLRAAADDRRPRRRGGQGLMFAQRPAAFPGEAGR